MLVKLRNFMCIIGWHGPVESKSFDGISIHSKCMWCGYEGMIDSQGNLF